MAGEPKYRRVSLDELSVGVARLRERGEELRAAIEGPASPSPGQLDDVRRRTSEWRDFVHEHLVAWFTTGDEAARWNNKTVRVGGMLSEREKGRAIVQDGLAWLATLVERAPLIEEMPEGQPPLDGAQTPTVALFLNVVEQRQVESFLHDLGAAIEADGAGQTDPDDVAVLDVEKETIETQLRSPRPNRGVVRSALVSIGTLLEAAAANTLGQVAFEVARRLSGG